MTESNHDQTPLADSVRLALPQEAARLAEIQLRNWRETMPAEAVEHVLSSVSAEEIAAVWQQAILRPPEARFRVLVAVTADGIAGFATTLPSQDGDADPSTDGAIEELTIDPIARRRGHGSRLLNACVDTLQADGFDRVTGWLNSTDDATRRFLEAAGWATDGSHRELGDEDTPVRIRQVRLHCSIGDANAEDPATA